MDDNLVQFNSLQWALTKYCFYVTAILRGWLNQINNRRHPFPFILPDDQAKFCKKLHHKYLSSSFVHSVEVQQVKFEHASSRSPWWLPFVKQTTGWPHRLVQSHIRRSHLRSSSEVVLYSWDEPAFPSSSSQTQAAKRRLVTRIQKIDLIRLF